MGPTAAVVTAAVPLNDGGAGTASATPSATATPTPTPTPSATPTPDASPSPAPAATAPPPPAQTLADGTHGYVVTSAAVIQAEPNTRSAIVSRLRFEQQLDLLGRVRGDRFVVGSQDWPMAIQDWSNAWYKVDGGYIYSAYVWVPKAGQVLPTSLPAGERSVSVNLATQTAQLLVSDQVVYTAGVTSGKDGYETPTGHWRVNYQVLNETMTSGQAGINDPAEHYDVKNVLFTQYFDGLGDALHLNYWQPESVFGNARTSHGCVGLFIQDAQYFWMFGQPGMRVDITQNGRILPPPPAPTRTAAPTSQPTIVPAAPARQPTTVLAAPTSQSTAAPETAATRSTTRPATVAPTPSAGPAPADSPAPAVASQDESVATATPTPTAAPRIGTASARTPGPMPSTAMPATQTATAAVLVAGTTRASAVSATATPTPLAPTTTGTPGR